MSGLFSRRTVLRTGLTVAAGSLAGCVFGEPDVEGGHLYVENTVSEDVTVDLTVAQGSDLEGEVVVDERYRLPQGHALQFEGVLERGQTYTIGARRPVSNREDSVQVTVRPCEGDPETGRDVSVRVRPDAMGVIPWGCSEEYERRELEYVSPEDYESEGAAESASPTNETD